MTSSSISSADFLTLEEREEGRFLRDLKGALREEVAARAAAGHSQSQMAALAGMDPAQFSRALSPDTHVSTRTLFRLAFALDRRWRVALSPLASQSSAGSNRPTVAHRHPALGNELPPSFARSAGAPGRATAIGSIGAPSVQVTAA